MKFRKPFVPMPEWIPVYVENDISSGGRDSNADTTVAIAVVKQYFQHRRKIKIIVDRSFNFLRVLALADPLSAAVSRVRTG